MPSGRDDAAESMIILILTVVVFLMKLSYGRLKYFQVGARPFDYLDNLNIVLLE